VVVVNVKVGLAGAQASRALAALVLKLDKVIGVRDAVVLSKADIPASYLRASPLAG
jgi:hypothetical protein